MKIKLEDLEYSFEANVQKFGKTAVLRLANTEANKIYERNAGFKATLWAEICEQLYQVGLFPEKYYPGFSEEIKKIGEGKELES